MYTLRLEILRLGMESIRDANEKIWCEAHGLPVERESVDVTTVEKILKDIERNFRSSNNVEGGMCPSTSKFYGYFREEILKTLIIFSKVISEGGYPGQ